MKSLINIGVFLYLVLLCLGMDKAMAQDYNRNQLNDAQSGCAVLLKHVFAEDSIHWNGPCKNNLAHGKGILRGYTKGKETLHYEGYMQDGIFNGQGLFTFWGDRKLEGNFVDGEPLFLSKSLLNILTKQIISNSDSLELYDGDNNKKQIYYHALIPKDHIRGVIVLLPGTWETTEHLLSSMRTFCELAYQKQLAILVPSINQHLTLNKDILQVLNTCLSNAIQRYNLPKDQFVFGGWSMGGIFSMRYAEFANENSENTVVKPKAVFNCDGPCDLTTVYNNFKRKLNKNPGQNEPTYGIKELETFCGGNPEQVPQQYEYYSPFTIKNDDGGNARYLLQTPIRIYGDVDPVWWMKNRHVDMYDLNAVNQTAMIQWLNDHGNAKATFINAYQKGIRLEGNRHPHSWSIVEPLDCIQWIEDCLK